MTLHTQNFTEDAYRDERNSLFTIVTRRDIGLPDLLSVDSSTSKKHGEPDSSSYFRKGGRRDGREDFILTPALAGEIAAALGEYIDAAQNEEAAKAQELALTQAKEAATQKRADYLQALAMVPGTPVRISEDVMYSRDEAHPERAALAGKLGHVNHHITSSFGSEPYGVEAGRVVVYLGVDADYLGGDDIHVSSLTAVEPDGFNKPTEEAYFDLRATWEKGDLVIVADEAWTTANPTSAAGDINADAAGTEFVEEDFFGKVGQIVAAKEAAPFSYQGKAVVEVRVNDETNYIHIAYLRNVSAEFRAADKLAGGVL